MAAPVAPPRPVPSVLPHRAEEVVALAVRAPSLHNAQPWRFRLRGDVLEVRADRSRWLPATDPTSRQLHVSCGAALLGARLAVERLGRRPEVALLPHPSDPDLLAAVRAGGSVAPSEEVRRLVAATEVRRTHRGRFTGEPVDGQLVRRLRDVAEQEGARLVVVQRPGTRRAVADLVAAAERAQQSHPGVRAELEDWTPAPGSGRRDGVPATAYPRQPVTPSPQELTPRDFAVGREQGRPAEPPAGEAPVSLPLVVVLLTGRDRPVDWLSAGAALHRVLLTAAAEGIRATLHGQATELDGLRRLLQDELLVNEQPQMLLQLGHVPPTPLPATPRRPVAEVLERL